MTLTAPLLALIAAVCFALARVILKRALQYSTPLAAVAVSVIFTGTFLWGIALGGPVSGLVTPLVLPFVAGGLFAPGLARLLVYVGVHRVGAARASALSSASPLFAILLAILFLGERPSWSLFVGAIGIVSGAVLLSQQGSLDTAWRRRDLAFPLLGALGFALRDNISRWGLASFPHPALAAAVATTTSMALIAGVMLGRAGELRFGQAGRRPGTAVATPGIALRSRALSLLALAGFCEALASLSLWGALAAGKVSVVSPLISVQPIFTVVLTVVFLRDLEQVTWRVAVATLAMVAGSVVVIRAGT